MMVGRVEHTDKRIAGFFLTVVTVFLAIGSMILLALWKYGIVP